MHLSLATIVVEDYDQAIGFFTGPLGFDLVEDSPAATNDGRPKRWVVVRPPGYGRVAVFIDIAGNKWDLIGES